MVHGADGLDEITTTDSTTVIEVRDGEIRRFELTPESVGLPRVGLDALAVGDPQQNAAQALSVLEGDPGPVRDMVVLNAAAGLVVGDVCDDLASAMETAAQAIDSGEAARTLGALVAVSRALLADDASD